MIPRAQFSRLLEANEMRFQRARTAAIGLLAAMVAAAALAPVEAATRAHPKKVQRVDGWGTPYYLTGGKEIFAPTSSAFGAYPNWARVAFDHQGG
jgi:hypothetical protein